MLFRLLALTAALWSCVDGGGGGTGGSAAECPQREGEPSPIVGAGDYRLEVTYVGGWGGGARIAVEPDGRFTGRGWEDLWMCDGTLSAAEAEAIATAINQADVVRRGSNPQPCADHAAYDIVVTGVAGDIAGREHMLRYEVCENECPELDAFIAAALAPAIRAGAEGPCTGCPPDLDAGECYGEVGSELICKDGEAHGCEGVSGVVVDCPYADSLQCDASSGWVSAAIWSVASATLYRWNEGGDNRIQLDLELEVDNRGASPVDLTRVFSLAVVLDDDDAAIDPIASGVASVSVVGAEGNSLATYGLSYSAGTAAGSPILGVSSPSIRIPERPWEGLPLLPAVPIEVVQAPPSGP